MILFISRKPKEWLLNICHTQMHVKLYVNQRYKNNIIISKIFTKWKDIWYLNRLICPGELTFKVMVTPRHRKNQVLFSVQCAIFPLALENKKYGYAQ